MPPAKSDSIIWTASESSLTRTLSVLLTTIVVSVIQVGTMMFGSYNATSTKITYVCATTRSNEDHPNLVVTADGTYQLTGHLLHTPRFGLFADIELYTIKPGQAVRITSYGWDKTVLGHTFHRQIINNQPLYTSSATEPSGCPDTSSPTNL